MVPSGLDPPVVGDRVAAVVGLRPRPQQRHQVQVADAELAQVRQPLAHARQRPGEAVDVGDVADGLLPLQPVGGDLALVVELLELGVARRGGARDGLEQRAELPGKRASLPYRAWSGSRSSVKNRSRRSPEAASPSTCARLLVSARTSARITGRSARRLGVL